jgi:hypothetical protein
VEWREFGKLLGVIRGLRRRQRAHLEGIKTARDAPGNRCSADQEHNQDQGNRQERGAEQQK